MIRHPSRVTIVQRFSRLLTSRKLAQAKRPSTFVFELDGTGANPRNDNGIITVEDLQYHRARANFAIPIVALIGSSSPVSARVTPRTEGRVMELTALVQRSSSRSAFTAAIAPVEFGFKLTEGCPPPMSLPLLYQDLMAYENKASGNEFVVLHWTTCGLKEFQPLSTSMFLFHIMFDVDEGHRQAGPPIESYMDDEFYITLSSLVELKNLAPSPIDFGLSFDIIDFGRNDVVTEMSGDGTNGIRSILGRDQQVEVHPPFLGQEDLDSVLGLPDIPPLIRQFSVPVFGTDPYDLSGSPRHQRVSLPASESTEN